MGCWFSFPCSNLKIKKNFDQLEFSNMRALYFPFSMMICMGIALDPVNSFQYAKMNSCQCCDEVSMFQLFRQKQSSMFSPSTSKYEHSLSPIMNLRGGVNMGSFASEWMKNVAAQTEATNMFNISRSPRMALDELVGKEVSVALEEGIECTGILESCDQDLNIWLKGSIQRRDMDNGNLIDQQDGSSMFIRGSNVVHIGRLEGETVLKS
jgi:small nuclear ribonucleoprotein (snRNP)-like protein